MKQKKNRFSFRETINEINRLSKQMIKEAYVYEDDMEMYDEEPMMGDEEDLPMGDTEDKVNQIRQLALDGIQEYAQDVDCPEYEFFKKVWMMCDKVCSDKNKEKEME